MAAFVDPYESTKTGFIDPYEKPKATDTGIKPSDFKIEPETAAIVKGLLSIPGLAISAIRSAGQIAGIPDKYLPMEVNNMIDQLGIAAPSGGGDLRRYTTATAEGLGAGVTGGAAMAAGAKAAGKTSPLIPALEQVAKDPEMAMRVAAVSGAGSGIGQEVARDVGAPPVVGGVLGGLTPALVGKAPEVGKAIARKLTGVGEILKSKGPELAPQRQAISEYIDDAAALAKTGKTSDVMASSIAGSPKTAEIEQYISGVHKYKDKAFNERQRIMNAAVENARDVANRLKAKPISVERAGKIASGTVKRAEKAIYDVADAEANINFSTVEQAFKQTKTPIGNKKTLQAIDDILNSPENLGRITEQVERAARSMKKAITGKGSMDIDSAMVRRRAMSKATAKPGRFMGFDDPGYAKDAANKILQAVEDDIADAAKNAEFISGQKGVFESYKKAISAYRGRMDELRKVQDTVFGEMVGKGESVNTKFGLKLKSMTPEEYRKTIDELRPYNENIDAQMGRFFIDEAINKTQKGAGKLATESVVELEKFFSELNDPKFINSFPKNNRQEVSVVLRHLARAADRAGQGMGGSAASGPAQAEADVMAGVGGNIVFMARQAVRRLMAPQLYKYLYTPEGRKALLGISKEPKTKRDVEAISQALFYLGRETQEEQ